METAVTLPFFLMAMISVAMVGEMVRFSGNLQTALFSSAKQLSVYAYALEHTAGNPAAGGAAAGGLLGKAVSLTAGRSMVFHELGGEEVRFAPVEGGTGGLSFACSSVLNRDQMIDLVVTYRMKLPFPLPGVKGFRVVDRARVRAFTGYDNTRREDLSEEEEIVFITGHGTVYHRSRDCRHLNLSIRETTAELVEKERNESGAKYYPCEYCGGSRGAGRLYITGDGDRYHTALSCPGLKRGIQAVPLSRTGGRPPCARCGK